MTGTLRVVGLMSGTSYDAIDVAAADFTLDGGTLLVRALGALSVPYEEPLRDAISAVLPPAATTVSAVCQLTTELGQAYAAAARRALTELCGGSADLVVSHGQTVFHWVAHGQALGSLQLGQPAWIAAATGLPVLADLRAADIAAGGQGAPLVPAFDALLLAPEPGTPTRRAALNLGGIANITILTPPADTAPAAGSVIGYDTGPASALIDAACRRFFDEPYDRDGRHAAAGTVLDDLLAALLAEPYYAAPAPKSTGKELFAPDYLDRFLTGLDAGTSDRADQAERAGRAGWEFAPDDVVATLTELTARTVADQLRAHRIDEVVAGGGGLRNPVLVARIATLSGARVRSIAELGVDPDAKEAYAFALLGWLSWHGLAGALPTVTGADRAAVLGSFTPGASPLRLPDPLPAPPSRLRLIP
jgi:anhydro-N-acetylmuramic acid kinase